MSVVLPVSWTALTSDTRPRPQPLAQVGGDNVFCVFHHAYNRLVQDTLALFAPGGKQVTATFASGPTYIGGPYHLVRALEDDQDPYTTASWVDRVALTAEISNLDLNPPYPVGAGGKEHFAWIIAYAHVTYGMPIDEYHVLSHQEAFARGWGSYSTACPGEDLQGAKAWMLARAKQIVAGNGGEEDDMQFQARYTDAFGGSSKRRWAIIHPELAGGFIEVTNETEKTGLQIAYDLNPEWSEVTKTDLWEAMKAGAKLVHDRWTFGSGGGTVPANLATKADVTALAQKVDLIPAATSTELSNRLRA